MKIIKRLEKWDDYHRCYYLQQCPKCRKIFEHVYKSNLQTCGCFEVEKHIVESGRAALKKGTEKNLKFGTNIGAIRHNKLPKNNTSGYVGVTIRQTNTGVTEYVASLGFQRHTHVKVFRDLDSAIGARKAMEKVREDFLAWYDSLNDDERRQKQERYDVDCKYFFNIYKSRLEEILKDF